MSNLTVSVVYQTGGGHTGVLAEAVARGCARVPDVSVEMIEIIGKDVIEGRWKNEAIFAKLDASDAIIFGCATYMGSGNRPSPLVPVPSGPRKMSMASPIRWNPKGRYSKVSSRQVSKRPTLRADHRDANDNRGRQTAEGNLPATASKWV